MVVMGKGKHNGWHKVQYKGVYCDDYEPSNKTVRKRIKDKINKEIKIILSDKKYFYIPPGSMIF